MNNTTNCQIPHPLDELVQNYLLYLKKIKNAPYHTFRAYNVDLSHFLKYFLRNEINEMPSHSQLDEYLGVIKNKYNYSSYRRKITALRNFITYLVELGINVPDPFVSITLPLPSVNFNLSASYEDILNLIESLPESTEFEIRDKLIFSLIAKSGLTVKQLLSLKMKDINIATNQIIISKSQLTFIDPKTANLIDNYYTLIKLKNPISLEDYLIANHFKGSKLPLSPRTINLIISKRTKENNFKSNMSPTLLRRLFAKSLMEKNINQEIRELIFGKKCRLVS